ncbi:MAG: hypothetical protein K9M57_04650, partial [Phycisphaerae bacterium]|nr:hypothetical protein [Phycisphaerae bacterium]
FRKQILLSKAKKRSGPDLTQGFITPPDSAKPRVFWWWLNSLVDREAITRDLEEFRAKGIGGVLIVDAGGNPGKEPMPSGPRFMGTEWRNLFKHALREANRLHLGVSVNLASGWCTGGPWVTPEYGMKEHAFSMTKVTGPDHFSVILPLPPGAQYRDVAVQAYPENSRISDRATLIDLTSQMRPDGRLDWNVPTGKWVILRFGYKSSLVKTAFPSDTGKGLHIDGWSQSALDFHYKSMASVLIDDAGPLAGKTLKYLHDDSWENGYPTWSDNFVNDFQKYRGYSIKPYIRVLADPSAKDEISNRFRFDFLKTFADAMADNHYGRLTELAHADGLGTHNEAAGPSWPMNAPMDGLKNLGQCDIPMGEFWMPYDAYLPNETGYNQNWVGKQTGSAAHIYGKKWAGAEAFTSLIGHWIEDPRSMKQAADIAFCEGINRFFFHESTCNRQQDGVPGYEYFAGTHFNPNLTWWRHAKPWLTWISRCQQMLSQGLFVGDVCYYLGNNIPEPTRNPNRIKHVFKNLGLGYDYDYCNADVILNRMSVENGRIVLPDGMSYRLLVLPDQDTMSVELLEKIKDLVGAGATIVGPKPVKDPGLKNYPQCDVTVQKLANKLWGDCDGVNVTKHEYGKGRVFWGTAERDILTSDGIAPDFQFSGKSNTYIDFIHRNTSQAEIYYVANRNDRWEKNIACTFRVSGKVPEIWDPITGSIRPAAKFTQKGETTSLSLEFAPFGSMFIVFRHLGTPATATGNFPVYSSLIELDGPWTVKFDPKWGGPESVRFDQLESWTARNEEGIKYYSGTATYIKKFDVAEQNWKPGEKLFLDLGEVKNLCEVRLNGQTLGTLWTVPFRIEISDAVKQNNNTLEIDVTNLWANRLVGDWKLPEAKRFTKTNVWHLYRDKKVEGKPLVSGLLGPVTLQK